MKKAIKSIILISIFAVLSVSCSTKPGVKDLTGFWQGECGRGFQFTDRGTYFFYFIENGTWKCSGDSENNFSVNGNEIRCEWTENGETKAICYSVGSFTKQKMTLRSGFGDISDGKYIKVSEPSHIDVEYRKSALASSILAQIDSLYLLYQKSMERSFSISKFELTEQEKLVKPDYLLDPSVANTLVTKLQKISALGIFVADIAVYKAYDMPYEGIRETALKLAADLNVPFDMDFSTGNEPVSEKIKATYKACKERGEESLFWQFECAVVTESIYILSQSPEVFLGKITQEQWLEWRVAKRTRMAVIKELAKYDEEMAQLWNLFFTNKPIDSDEENDRVDQSIETARQYYLAHKDRYTVWRNAMLQ